MASVMQPTFQLRPLQQCPSEPAARFVILYEDVASGLRAKRFADRLNYALGAEAGPSLALWRQEMLELPELAQAASREAQSGDFLILSLLGNRHLSFAVRQWLEEWLERASASGAGLIAIFDPMRSTAVHTDGVRQYLRCVTKPHEVDFFCHCNVIPDVDVEDEPLAVPLGFASAFAPLGSWRSAARCAA
jgi:hypothetical protein